MTTEELHQIRQVVREEIHAETEPINKRLAGMDKRFDSIEQEMRAGFQKVNQRLDQEINNTTGFFHETWKRIDEIKDSHEKRIDLIEETLRLAEPPHKN